MAKISAYGAHEIARIHANSAAGYPHIMVITSDGRILTRFIGNLGSNYTIVAKVANPAKRTAETLVRYAELRGYTAITVHK